MNNSYSVVKMAHSDSLKSLAGSAKRARNGSPGSDINLETGKPKTLPLDARHIQEGLRAYMKRNDKKSVGSIRDHISNKVQCLVDMIETLQGAIKEEKCASSLVSKVIDETLSSQRVHEMLAHIVETSVSKLIETLPVTNNAPQRKDVNTSPTRVAIPQDRVIQPGPSRDQLQLVTANTNSVFTPLENDSFQLVTRRKRKNKKGVKGGKQNSEKEPKIEKKPKSMADIVKSLPKKPAENKGPTYITISGMGKNPSEIINELPSPTEIGIKATIVRATKAGSVLVRMDDITEATKVIGWQTLRDQGLQAKLALRKKPRLEVRGVPRSWNSAELVRYLWGRIPEKSGPTPLIMDDIRPLFSSVARNGFTRNWVVEVHPSVRFLLLEIGSLDGGWWAISFHDYIDAPRCSKCQGYGHTKATCAVDAVVCIWCAASGHVIRDCHKKKELASPSCINCERANAPNAQRKHKAGSRDCPVHLKWAKEVAKKTFYE